MSADPVPFNWRNPDYLPVLRERMARLQRLRAHPEALPLLRAFYRDNPAQFIDDFGWTSDPRRQPSTIPLILFPMQHAMVEFILRCWHGKTPGLIEKSRDVGASVVAMSLAATLCIFHPGATIGIGSRKEQLLDNQGDPSSLFFKARQFLEYLPPEFRPVYTSAHMRLVFANGSAIIGEAGSQIGRGARTSLFIVDESAYLEAPELAEASLSATTDTRVDISSVNGLNNPFARKRFSGRIPVFTASWRQDPRKDAAWYAKKSAELPPAVVASEIDLDYMGSVEGQLIPSAWIQASIGAAARLGIPVTGAKYGAFDVGDEGRDRCAFAMRHGVSLQYLKQWSGRGSDLFKSTVRVFGICDELGLEAFFYDGGGMGSAIRGDANTINDQRAAVSKSNINAELYLGAGAVHQPDSQMVPRRANKDMFLNRSAQSWWHLRTRFANTHRAVVDRLPVDVDSIISLDPKLPDLLPLQMELSQVQYGLNAAGKTQILKQPAGTSSPNLGDALSMCFQPASLTLELWARLGRSA
jgi:phage terminase large subunit